VFKSTNGGGTWNAFSTGLSNNNVVALAINPQTTNIVYAGTYGTGVFATRQGFGIYLPIVLRGQ
jgi:hypothetical protein